MAVLADLYTKDYSAWTSQTAQLLRARQFTKLDIEHLLEELEGMGSSERRELENRFRVLLAHLLKWQFQYQNLSSKWQEFDGRSWNRTIKEQRRQLIRLMQRNPGLKTLVPSVILTAYQDAREDAADESNLPLEIFPAGCPYSQTQILNKDFYPTTDISMLSILNVEQNS